MLLISFEKEIKIQLLTKLGVAASILVNDLNIDAALGLGIKSLWVKTNRLDQVVTFLDKGIDKVVIDGETLDAQALKTALEGLPKDRLVLELPRSKPEEFSDVLPIFGYFIGNLSGLVDSSVLFKRHLPFELDVAIQELKNDGNVLWNADSYSEDDAIQVFVDLLFSKIHSDRADGLIPTVVVDEQKISLGLCYSSKDSVRESIRTKSGVYLSRTRGLWYKGATSGATQELFKIDLDCDSDALQFTVSQKGPGFCHLNTRSCFGQGEGISGLYQVLESRLKNSPPESYTKRLFKDSKLLQSKIMEEAKELCEAEDKNDIAWEAADLLYFMLTKCVASGVALSDIEKNLNFKAKKVTRRPGNAKQEPKSIENPIQAPSPSLATYNMQVHHLAQVGENYNKLLQRPILNTAQILERVKPIVDKVIKDGDKALREYTKTFDGVQLESVVIKAPFDDSLMSIDPKVKDAIDLAYENIHKFHAAQLETKPLVVETMPGVVCSRFSRPIERVGLYVPGGTAILPSTALMLGVPARVAGCKEIVIASPPRKDGTITPEVVYVAHKIGASTILAAGGAQAVAAMAYGTETVPKVDKICGPGNQYVTAAKMIAQSDSSALISIDMPAGPSELLVIADTDSNFSYVVSDLLSQAEHGVDSQVVLVTVGFTQDHLDQIQKELERQSSVLPRCDIVKVSLSKSFILSTDTMEKAIEFSNAYAPEHLILNVSNAAQYIKDITSAGSVFVGAYSPESCGDYASGTNHTLPTYGYSRMYSGVNTNTFMKHITSQELTAKGLDSIGDCVTTLAELEGLEAHRNAVAIRLKDLRK